MIARLILLLMASAAFTACSKSDRAQPAPPAADEVIDAVPMLSAPLDRSKTLTRIVFASCAEQNEDQSIWDQIAAENPDLMLYIGDNVYGDTTPNDPELSGLKAAYSKLAQSEPFSRAREAAPLLTIWDDHDYGLNDGDGNYQHKQASEALYEYVWAIPDDDPRRARPGVYGAWTIGGETGKRVQIILLDTRFFRSELMKSDEPGAHGKERYIPDPAPEKTMLGEDQWSWLESELEKPADLRLLVSSVQIIAEGHGWEGWKMLPAERDRLYALIKATGADNLVMLSGDRHAAALYRNAGANDYPLFEATSSSLNLPVARWREESGETWIEPGPNRLGDMYMEANYGLIEIDWEAGAVAITIRDPQGKTVLGEVVELASLH